MWREKLEYIVTTEQLQQTRDKEMPRDKLLGSLTLWHGWISALKIIVSRYLSELFLEHWGHITKDMAVCDTVCGYTLDYENK